MQATLERARAKVLARARVGYLVTAVVLGAGALGVLVHAALSSGAPTSRRLGEAAVAAVLLAFAWAVRRVAESLRRPLELRETGEPATATLERVLGGGMSLEVSGGAFTGNISQLRLRLRIEIPGRAPYSIDHAEFLPGPAYAKLLPGTSFPAFVDRRRPERVLVDFPTSF